MLRRIAAVSILAGTTLAAVHCTDDGDGAAAGPTLDASTLDVRASSDSASVDSASTDAASAVDASDAAAPVDAAQPDDGGTDAELDAGFDADPGVDDAGCPLPRGTVVSAADAGLPSSGLVLWLRADTALATTDGGAVCRWDDVSGSGHAFLPGTATHPSLDATGLKGKPAVSFSATNRHLVRGDTLGLAATSARTVAVIGATQDTTHRFQYFFQGKSGSAGTYFGLDQNTFSTAGSREGAYVTNNAYDTNVATTTNARIHVLSLSTFTAGTALPGALVYAIDGTPATLTRTAGGLGNGTVESFANADFTTIGGAAAGFTGAKLGEMLVYDHALTTLERAAVEAYLTSRFP